MSQISTRSLIAAAIFSLMTSLAFAQESDITKKCRAEAKVFVQQTKSFCKEILGEEKGEKIWNSVLAENKVWVKDFEPRINKLVEKAKKLRRKDFAKVPLLHLSLVDKLQRSLCESKARLKKMGVNPEQVDKLLALHPSMYKPSLEDSRYTKWKRQMDSYKAFKKSFSKEIKNAGGNPKMFDWMEQTKFILHNEAWEYASEHSLSEQLKNYVDQVSIPQAKISIQWRARKSTVNEDLKEALEKVLPLNKKQYQKFHNLFHGSFTGYRHSPRAISLTCRHVLGEINRVHGYIKGKKEKND